MKNITITSIPNFTNANTTNHSEIKKVFDDNIFFETSGLLGILTRCCAAFGVTIDDVKSSSRKEAFVFARQAYCMLANRQTSHTQELIGKLINRDRSTVTNSIKKVNDYLDINYKPFTDIYNTLLIN